MRNVLFVDDDANILQGLQRMLRPWRREWNVVCALSGAEALSLLEGQEFDVVVTDMRMPGMNGADLLAEIMNRHPNTIRMVLSGHSENELILKAVLPAHQYLSKPCPPETLVESLLNLCALYDLLSNEDLRRLILSLKSLPSVPQLYLDVMAMISAEDVSVQKIADLVARDIGMSAKLLQVVNSAYFGCKRHVTHPAQAIQIIGLDTLKSLLLSVHLFSQYDEKRFKRFSLQNLWRHSCTVAAYSRAITQYERLDANQQNVAFMAGMLHDAGKLILATEFPDKYDQVVALTQEHGLPLEEAEQQVFGATHSAVGAYLLGVWGLPCAIVEAVAWHHRPGAVSIKALDLITVVHVADALSYQKGNQSPCPPASIEPGHLEQLELENRLPVWQQLCQSLEQENEP